MRSIFLSLFVATTVHATAFEAPPFTADTLVGVWEAIPSHASIGNQSGVFRMEISKDSESYLVLMVGMPQQCQALCRLVSSQIHHPTVTLEFECFAGAGRGGHYSFHGRGFGGDCPELVGKLKWRGASGGEATGDAANAEIWFRRSSWTRELDGLSRGAEQVISEERGKPKT